jgi:hypothetical protein
MRRLGIALATIASFTWIILITVASYGFAHIEPRGWIIFLIGIPTCFALGFLVVWSIDWVITGFHQG